jgi:uncharacterized protein with beta-barrel porin domain
VTGGTSSEINTEEMISGEEGGTAIQGGPGADDFTNEGSVLGDVLLGAGDDSATLVTGSSVSGVLDGEGGTNDLRLEGDGSGALDLGDLNGFDSLVVDGMGQWSLSGMASFPGGATVQQGTIRLDDTTAITGDVEFMDGTELSIVRTGSASGFLDVDGNVTLGNTSLSLVQQDIITEDTVIQVLNATGTLTGTFTSIPQDTPLLSFSLVPGLTPDSLALQVLRTAYADFAGTPNQRAAAMHLDAILGAGFGDDMEAVLMELDGLPASQLAMAYDQIHPEAYDAHTGGMAELGRAFAEVATRSRMPCRRSILDHDSVRPLDAWCGSQTLSAWIEAIGSQGTRDAGSDFRHFDMEGRGLVGGFDWRPSELFTVTGWTGLAAMDMEGESGEDGDIETFELGAAGILHWAGIRARAAFGYGHGDHEQRRTIRFGGLVRTAESEFSSHRILALFEAGYVLAAAGFELEPLASLETTYVLEEAVEESGAGSLELEMGERANVLFSTAFGTLMRYRWLVNPYSDNPRLLQGIWTPEVEVRWRGTFTGADREIDARLAGAPDGVGDFTAQAQDSEQGVDLGARLIFQPGGTSGSVTLGYDGFFGDNGTDHRIAGRVHMIF